MWPHGSEDVQDHCRIPEAGELTNVCEGMTNWRRARKPGYTRIHIVVDSNCRCYTSTHARAKFIKYTKATTSIDWNINRDKITKHVMRITKGDWEWGAKQNYRRRATKSKVIPSSVRSYDTLNKSRRSRTVRVYGRSQEAGKTYKACRRWQRRCARWRGGLGNDAVGRADTASGEPPLADGLHLGLRARVLRGDLDWRLLGGESDGGERIHLV